MSAPRRVGLYPGTFDPVTLGHLDIVKRAVKLVDHLVIGVATGTGKAPLFSLEERVEMWAPRGGRSRRERRHHRVSNLCNQQHFLQVKFAQSVGANVIIRGLRAVSDFEYEFQMVAMNQRLNSEIETVFLMADPRHQAIASRLVKEIAFAGRRMSAPSPTPAIAPRLWSNAARNRNANGSRSRKYPHSRSQDR